MRIRVAHASLEYKDSDSQHTHDIEKIFDRAVERRYAWLTGTEAGPGSGNTGEEILRVSREHGYLPWVPQIQGHGISERTDCWIAVRKDLVDGEMEKTFDMVVPGSKHLEASGHQDYHQRWGPKGVVAVHFNSTNEALGEVSIAAGHYIQGAHTPDDPAFRWNEELAAAIGDWAKEQGRGPALVFYGGDQNSHDNKNERPEGDSFHGEPITSVWDELRHYENTGHGTIDVIATYNRDGRVSAMEATALNDREFHLNVDHFFIEATLRVEPRNH
jgi:hypothetical protein